MINRSISIRHKLTVALLVAVAVASVLSGAWAAWRETQQRLDIRRESVMAIAATLATSLARSIETRDLNEIQRRLNAVRAISNVRYAIVADNDGRRLHEIGTGVVLGSVSEPMAANRDISIFTTLRLGTYLVSQPIVSGGQHVGHIALIVDVSELRWALLESALGALAAGAVAAALGILGAARLKNSIVGPIVALTNATETIRRSSDYAQIVPRTSADETGRLVDTFNAMLREIQVRDASLRQQRDHLAEEVQERTKELVVAKVVAEQANAAKSDFLATMSHEIRTPMNGMLVMAEMLASEPLSPRARRHCDVILKSGQTLLSIINDILDLSKIEAGQMHLERIDCDPATIVDDVVQLFSERAAASGLEVACYIDPGVPEAILSDPLRLRQILSNLIGNALKFTHMGGVLVRLSAVWADGVCRLHFSVRDSGIGIPADRLQSLFEAFTQVEASTTRRFGGTGIGLTICRRLATALAGEIRVESQVGQGSTFTLDIPAVLAPGTVPAPLPLSHGGQLALLVRAGPVRDALVLIARSFRLDVVGEEQLSSARVIICDADWHGVGPLVEGASTPVLIVPRAGHAKLPRAATLPTLLLQAPLGGHETRQAILSALEGRLQGTCGQISPVAPVRGTPGKFAGRRVLAVDDNEANLEVLSEALARFEIAVTCVTSGTAAIAALGESSFELVFMDGSMPEMDGFETCRRLRAIERSAGRAPVPIIALTAHVIGVQADDWRDAGMSEYLAKPYTLQQIADCLERWIGSNAAGSAQVQGIGVPPAPPSPSKTGEAPLIDRDVLQSIREMQVPGDDLVQRVIGLFVRHAPPSLEKVVTAAGSDAVATANAAHALKSLCRSIGAVRLGDACEAIEGAAQAGSLPTPASLQTASELLDMTIGSLTAGLQQAA